jgi:tRNA pseudouridine55 synthase
MAEEPPAPAVWLVDKPAGPTSHDIVARIRRNLPRKTKVGHAGTLDPFATGLLVILVGSATRLSRYLVGLSKRYEATFRLGFRSETLDPEGPIHPGGDLPARDALEAALREIAGRGSQPTPAYSAARVDGERLWRAARRGEAVPGPERQVSIHELTLTAFDENEGTAEITTHCASGTYVRQIAADVGDVLSCGAYCSRLRRIAIGPWTVTDAVPPEGVGRTGGLDLREGLPGLGTRHMNDAEAREVSFGRSIAAGDAAEDVVALVDDRGLRAVAENAGGLLRPKAVLA